jgi:hypothetical protein
LHGLRGQKSLSFMNLQKLRAAQEGSVRQALGSLDVYRRSRP